MTQYIYIHTNKFSKWFLLRYLKKKGYTFRNSMTQEHIFIHPYGRYAFCMCEGGYKRSGHMYLILQDVNSNRIFSINASPEDYHIYHNKPGTVLTYTFKEFFIAPNKIYDLYRSIFLTGISLLAGLLVTFPLLFDIIDISEEMTSTLMIATLILLGTSILSYNFVI